MTSHNQYLLQIIGNISLKKIHSSCKEIPEQFQDKILEDNSKKKHQKGKVLRKTE